MEGLCEASLYLDAIIRNCVCFLDLFLIFVYVFVCTNVHVHAGTHDACSRREHWISGDGVTGSCEPPDLGAGAELSPLLEQDTLMTTEPSPAPPHMFGYCMLCYLLPTSLW